MANLTHSARTRLVDRRFVGSCSDKLITCERERSGELLGDEGARRETRRKDQADGRACRLDRPRAVRTHQRGIKIVEEAVEEWILNRLGDSLVSKYRFYSCSDSTDVLISSAPNEDTKS